VKLTRTAQELNALLEDEQTLTDAADCRARLVQTPIYLGNVHGYGVKTLPGVLKPSKRITSMTRISTRRHRPC